MGLGTKAGAITTAKTTAKVAGKTKAGLGAGEDRVGWPGPPRAAIQQNQPALDPLSPAGRENQARLGILGLELSQKDPILSLQLPHQIARTH